MIILKFILIISGLILAAAVCAGVLYISQAVAWDKRRRRDCVDLSVDEAVEQFEREQQ